MQIVCERPPIWDALVEILGKAPNGAIFAWGDTIYNPDRIKVTDYLVVHEKVHGRQQQAVGSVEAWWAKYLADPEFRFAQEVEAYGAQFAFMGRAVHRNQRRLILTELARILCTHYGVRCPHDRARGLIKRAAPA